MKDRKSNKPPAPPAIRTALERGIYREVTRHELHPGSWQQELHDRQGRRFYEPAGGSSTEPAGIQQTVDEAAVEAGKRGNVLMVKSPWGGEVVPYDEFTKQREEREGAVQPTVGSTAAEGTGLKLVQGQAAEADGPMTAGEEATG